MTVGEGRKVELPLARAGRPIPKRVKSWPPVHPSWHRIALFRSMKSTTAATIGGSAVLYFTLLIAIQLIFLKSNHKPSPAGALPIACVH